MGNSYTRIVDILWRSNSGQATAGINTMNTSLRRTGINLRQNAQATGLMARQMHTLGTTMRYAFSSAALFGMVTAFHNMVEFRAELSQLNGVLQTTPANLDKFGQAALRISTQTVTPLNDVVQSMQNIAQSIPGLSDAAQKHLIPAMAKIEAMGAKVSGTDPRSFGATVLSTATAFYNRKDLTGKGGPALLERVASQLVTAQFRSNKTTGQDIATYIPMLTGGAISGKFDLSQMLAMYTTAQRVIGRPATTTQYLRQLMLRMQNPTPAAQGYFNQAGLTREVITNQPGMDTLKQLIAHGLSLQGSGLPKGMTPEQFMASGGFQSLNVKGDAATYFQKTVGGRQQSLVAVNALVRNLGQLAIETKAQNQAAKTNSLTNRFNSVKSNQPLSEFSNTMHNFMIDTFQSLLPALNPAARGGTALLKAPGAKEVALGLGGVAAFAAIRKATGHSGGLLKFLRGGGVAGGLGAAEMLQPGAPTGKPDSPFFVVVMNSMGSAKGVPSINTPGGTGKAAQEEEKIARSSLGRRILGKVLGTGSSIGGLFAGSKAVSLARDIWAGSKYSGKMVPTMHALRNLPVHLWDIARSNTMEQLPRSTFGRIGNIAGKYGGKALGKAAGIAMVEVAANQFYYGMSGFDVNAHVKSIGNKWLSNRKKDVKDVSNAFGWSGKELGHLGGWLSGATGKAAGWTTGKLTPSKTTKKQNAKLLHLFASAFSSNNPSLFNFGNSFKSSYEQIVGSIPGGGGLPTWGNMNRNKPNGLHAILGTGDVKGLLQSRPANQSAYQTIQIIEHKFALTDEAKKYLKEKEKKVHPPRTGASIAGGQLVAGNTGGPIPSYQGKPKAP